ncbi:MAG: ankyrin repeat domain-containing protein [Phycisphaerales bacterium]|nr:ankyrin repeat domain-containing protein [Phycisphaerales bacterium]
MTAFAICAVAYVAAAQPRRHISPLHAAVWSGRIETLEALIASGAAVDVRLTHDRPSSEAGGMTPLMLAARLGRADMVSVLIDAGADPLRGSGPYGHRALAHAAARGHRDVMRVLLSDTRRTNISPHLYRGSTLGTAAYHGQFEIVSEFMPRDGRNLSPPLIDLPLFRYIAAGRTEGHAKIIELFLCSGLDPNLDAHGAPLLIHAVGTGHLRTIEALLSHGADPSSMDWQGRSTLDHAAIRGDVAVLKLVLGSVDEEAVQDADAILFAAAHCDAEGLQLLLDGGASIARTDAQGRGVLHYACAFGRADNLNALLAYGADVDQRDQSGETAAFVAARQYPREFAETFQLAVMRLVLVDLDRDGLCLAKLRSAHADLSIRSLAGTTVADVVAKSGNAARQRSAGGNVSETKIE